MLWWDSRKKNEKFHCIMQIINPREVISWFIFILFLLSYWTYNILCSKLWTRNVFARPRKRLNIIACWVLNVSIFIEKTAKVIVRLFLCRNAEDKGRIYLLENLWSILIAFFILYFRLAFRFETHYREFGMLCLADCVVCEKSIFLIIYSISGWTISDRYMK